jgi:4-amino-4-deoxy-L-arabinose transferase-like glycosyltransferase
VFPSVLTPLHRWSPVTLAGVLSLLAFLAFAWRLGEGPIYRTMEGREALVMQEIIRSGNWILPLRNGETIPSKPPLLHWLSVLTACVEGTLSEWSVRFPCALLSAFSVGLTCLLGCRLAGREVGVLAGLFLLTTPGFVEMTREGWVDPVLSFFVLAALASFSAMYESDIWGGWRSVAFSLSLAGAALSKGPVGFLLPAVVIFPYLALQRQLALARHLLTVPVVVLAVGPPLLWYLCALQQEGWAFFRKQVLQENVLRFTVGSGKRIPSTLFFLLPAVQSGFPWSVLFCVGLWNFSRQAPVREKGVFPLIWWLAVLMFFSISAGKREVYLLPAYPALALFAAEWGWPVVMRQTRPLPQVLRRSIRLLALGLSMVIMGSAVCVATGYLGLDAAGLDRWFGENKWNSIAPYIRFVAEQPFYSLSVFSLLCGGGVWAVYAGTAGRWPTAAWVSLACFLLVSVGMYPFTRAYFKEFKAFTGFAAVIRQTVSPQAPLFFYTLEPFSSEFDEFSQVYFYLGRHVPLAPCAEQDFSTCKPGYYLMREGTQSVLYTTPSARVVCRSIDAAGPDAEAQLILVHVPPPRGDY